MVRVVFITLILLGCGGGNSQPPEEEPKRCEKGDPKTIELQCTGDPRICRVIDHCPQ